MWWWLFQAKYVIANMHSLEQNKEKIKPGTPVMHIPVFQSLQQLPNKICTSMDVDYHADTNCCEQTLLIHECISSRIFMSCSLHVSAEAPVTIFKATQPSFPGGGDNFKWKGTLFIRPEWKTYQGFASALNQPGLHDMLKWQSRPDWKKAGRIGHEERNRGRYWEWMWQRETADKSDLARPHLCKSHHIFPFTYF